MDAVQIELLVVPECAREAAMTQVLEAALDDLGLAAVGYMVTTIESQEHAERRHFIGSPTICVDGADLFPAPERPASIACRVYPGPGGVPDVVAVRLALTRAAAADRGAASAPGVDSSAARSTYG